MSRVTQSKAQNELNAKTLRALVKQPDNKTCADCKKNDPRWASWNIGCFLCIRCSGIHRSMGTHISKVKSIDLDIWTPEQMASIQKWGNKRANLYWEAHLRAGHAPPDHKVESFIRSKYETRRWAKEGPPPQDPGVLDGASGSAAAATASAAASPPAAAARAPTTASQVRASAIDLLGGDAPPPASSATTSINRGGSASLLDDGPSTSARSPPQRQPAKAPAPAAAPTAANSSSSSRGGGGLFDLEWHDPPPQQQASSARSPTIGNNKSDILSLFNSARPAQPAGAMTSPVPASQPSAFSGLEDSFGSFGMGGGGGAAQATHQNTFSSPPPQPPSSANPWASNTTPTQMQQQQQSAPQSQPQPQPNSASLYNSSDIWGDFSGGGSGGPSTTTTTAAKADDPFGDIWK